MSDSLDAQTSHAIDFSIHFYEQQKLMENLIKVVKFVHPRNIFNNSGG